jgi:hypothetical protein
MVTGYKKSTNSVRYTCNAFCHSVFKLQLTEKIHFVQIQSTVKLFVHKLSVVRKRIFNNEVNFQLMSGNETTF